MINAGGNFKFDMLALALRALATANTTELFRDLTTTMALWAGTSLTNIAKDSSSNPKNLPATLAFAAFFEAIAGFNGCTFAMFAGILQVEFQLRFSAKNGLF